MHMFFENVRGENKGFDLLHLRDDGASMLSVLTLERKTAKREKTYLKITCI